jgi:lipid A 3-O-deacylase
MKRHAILAIVVLVTAFSAISSPCHAEDISSQVTIGTQEVGLTAGYLLPMRLTTDHTTKQKGPALMPSWMMTLTDPIGQGWYRGQVSIGAEVVYIQFQEPVVSNGVGFTPKIKYTFVADNRIRPYVEFAGGPFWTDFTNQVPEESSSFNFILTAGVGCSFFITSQASINVGYRFHHISNAGTSYPNLGLNSSLPFGGFSFYF